MAKSLRDDLADFGVSLVKRGHLSFADELLNILARHPPADGVVSDVDVAHD